MSSAHLIARRAVEGGEEAVAGPLHLAAAVEAELAADDRVMALEQLAPVAIAELRGAGGRADDVGERHGREHAVVLARRPGPGEELLDLVDDRVGVAEHRQVVGALELHQPRVRDPLGHVPGSLDGCDPLGGAVQDQGRDVHHSQDVADVDLGERLQHPARHRRARAGALIAAPHLARALVVGIAGREHLEQGAVTPAVLDLEQPAAHDSSLQP